MKALFSEFSYGYSLTHEFVTQYSSLLTAAPTFPSLIAEGQTGGGYDVNIPFAGYPLFLQFKLSEEMIRSNASEAYLLGAPYFRFKLRSPKYSDQHALMLKLESEGNFVYYAAPIFREVSDLNTAFFGKNVVSMSLFIKPSDIGPIPDLKEHCIVFDSTSLKVYFCSEHRRVSDALRGESFPKSLVTRRSERQPMLLNEASFRALGDQMLSVATPEQASFDSPIINKERQTMDAAVFVTYLSRTLFDCELLFVRD